MNKFRFYFLTSRAPHVTFYEKLNESFSLSLKVLTAKQQTIRFMKSDKKWSKFF